MASMFEEMFRKTVSFYQALQSEYFSVSISHLLKESSVSKDSTIKVQRAPEGVVQLYNERQKL